MKKPIPSVLTLALAGTLASSAMADVVYITGTGVEGQGANSDGTYTELITGSWTSAASTAPGVPARNGSRFQFSAAFSNTIHTGESAVRLTPTLGVPGGIYQIHYTHSSLANNTSQDAIAAFTAVSGGSLSFELTDAFQRRYGQPAPQQWRLLGFLTNDPGSTTPIIEFRLHSSTNINSSTARFMVDCFRFTLYEPCLDVADVTVVGPLAATLPTVVVSGVTNATQITVYQDSGSGMVPVGSRTTGIVNGNNAVPVSGLAKGAFVAATQTVNGQEGCVPTAGIMVGGGANPTIRMALSIRETPSTGPIGSAGISTSANIHFLGSSNTIAGAPGGGVVLQPSTNWQTVTFDRQTELVGNSANVQGAVQPPTPGGGFFPDATVQIRVYAHRTIPSSGVTIYSQVGAESAVVTSNASFAVQWTWDAVPGADGYRLLRNVFGEFNEYLDVTGTSLNDEYFNFFWQAAGPDAVLPNVAQNGPSVQWNPSLSNTNALPGTWGILEAIAFAIEDLTDTGPFDIYIDNLANGDTVFQDFESVVAGTTDFGFRAPRFSGTTGGNLLPAPNQGVVVSAAADTGTKSFRAHWQWSTTNANRWLRLTTSGVGNPQVNLDLPITMRVLLLPVGSTPVPPAGPELMIVKEGDDVVLDWPGVHRLQSATSAEGPFTTIPGVTVGPYTNSPPFPPERYFRLVD